MSVSPSPRGYAACHRPPTIARARPSATVTARPLAIATARPSVIAPARPLATATARPSAALSRRSSASRPLADPNWTGLRHAGLIKASPNSWRSIAWPVWLS